MEPKNRKWKRSVGMLAVAGMLAFSAFACGDDDDGNGGGGATQEPTTENGGNGAAQAATVAIADNSFTPSNVTIATGGTVIWEWSGEFPHSVVGEFAGEPVESETLTGTGSSFSFTFEEAGTFNYQCGVHGDSMSGTIVIEA